MRTSLLAVATLASATLLSAQNDTQFFFNVATGATTRGIIGVNAGQQGVRYDNSDYIGYGNAINAGAPPSTTGYEVNGAVMVMQDQNDATPETYFLHLYPEDPTRPHWPNCQPAQLPGTGALASFGPFTMATTGTAGGTISAFIYTLNFATPVVRAANQDFFMAIEHSASPGWAATDGGSTHINLGISANFPPPTVNTFDLRGPGVVGAGLTNNSYGFAHNTTTLTQTYGGARQYRIIPLVAAGGRGVVTTVTNQASYPISNVAPGTASFFSGLHPDASTNPTNGGRVDNSGYVFFGAPAGSLIAVLIDLGTQTPQFPLSNYLAGSSGVQCVTFAASTAAVLPASGAGQDAFAFNWTPGQRVFLTSINITFQGIALDGATNTIIGGPCGTQHF